MRMPWMIPGLLAGRTRWGRRGLLLALVGIGLVYHMLTSSSSSWAAGRGSRGLESVRLEHYMNAHARDKVWGVPPSFDWSKVQFAHPPGPDIPLPTASPPGGGGLPRVQAASFPPETAAAAAAREARRAAVRGLFQKNWASYRARAWMRDALLPVSGGGRDQFSGWAATLVDSLDTLWIMGLRDEFDEAVDAVAAGVDFGRPPAAPRVNMFETNIRYLGGLLGAYELSRRGVLLQKAVELGDMLYAGFNTDNGMPVDFFDVERSRAGGGLPIERRVAAAGPGTLLMELTRLSQLTGDLKYYSAVSRLASVFEAGQMRTAVPGLWPTTVSMQTMNVVDGSSFTLGSGADSLYEYVTKMYALLGGREDRYRAMSLAWMDAAAEHMLYRPMLPPTAAAAPAGGHDDDDDDDDDDDYLLFAGNLAVADTPSGRELRLDPESEHLSCFLGATYALGGRLFARDDYLDTAARLTRGCAWAYRATATGMMCERFNLVPCPTTTTTTTTTGGGGGGSGSSSGSRKPSRRPCPWDEAAFEAEKEKKGRAGGGGGGGGRREGLPAGFTTCKDPRYLLRPEAAESLFYLWRVTGRAEYQEAAWDMFVAVANGTATEFANAAVVDVTSSKWPPEKEDYMESFWLAETLKYFYLALSPPDLISLDEYVLNTEAHPFRLPR